MQAPCWTIKADTLIQLFPPDAAISDHLPIHFSKEHIGLRIAVDQVAELVGDVVHSNAAFNFIRHFAGCDERSNLWVIHLTLVITEG
jgi:hypothetical protein